MVLVVLPDLLPECRTLLVYPRSSSPVRCRS
ncbi:hypothetical protein ABXR35_16085 [Paenibacillus sp. JQZ6Y-1]